MSCLQTATPNVTVIVMKRISQHGFIASALMTALTIAVVTLPVSASAGMVSADSLRIAVIDAIETYAAANGMKIESSVPVVSNILVNGVDEPVISVRETVIDNGSQNCRIPVDILDTDGSVVRSVTVVARVKHFANVAVAAVEMSRDYAMTADDIVFEETVVNGLDGYYTDASQLEGMQAIRTIRPGMALTARNTRPIPLVKRGDHVTIRVTVGSVLITADGVSRQDGGRGETIRVYNQTTKKTLEARVVDTSTVVVGGEGG